MRRGGLSSSRVLGCVVVVNLLVLLLGSSAYAQPPLKWCSLPPATATPGTWLSPATDLVDLNSDGVADVVITGFMRPPHNSRALVVLDNVLLFQSAASTSVEIEIFISTLVFRDRAELEGQGCTADLKQPLRGVVRAGSADVLFFGPDSNLGKAFMAFYRKYGAPDAQLTSLIPRYACDDPPGCTKHTLTFVPRNLLLTVPTPTASPLPSPVPSPSP